jgi:hypothetical protein
VTPTTTPKPTPTVTPTSTPATGLNYYRLLLCCDSATEGIVGYSGTLSVGDVITDTDNNCWLVTDSTTGTPTVTFGNYIGTDCQECINEFGCFWRVDCCENGPDVQVVNDLGYPPFNIGNSSLKCTDNICRVVVGLDLGPETIGTIQFYDDCAGCLGGGGDPCPKG